VLKHPALRWFRRAAVVLIGFAVLDYLVLPQIAGSRKAIHLLNTINPWLAATAVALEALALVAYSLLTRNRPHFAWLIRTDVTALGVSHLLPGGAATSSALRYRLLREGGISAADAGVGMAVQGVGSNLVLAALTWAAMVVSIPFVGVHLLYVAAAVLGGLLIAASALAIVLRSREAAPSRAGLRRLIQHLPARFRPRIERTVENASAQTKALLSNRRLLRTSITWAAASWLLDASSLWVFLAAYGHQLNPDGLLIAYGIANLVAILPISPGGLGILEAVIIPSLVGFGTPKTTAVLAVVSWRLFNFWAPIPVSGLCYTSLRTEKWQRRRKPAGARRGSVPTDEVVG
jgi:uncharacterized protein (TIRG00374 family)